ncbi:uncharacterized protein LOC116338887 [Contarinia nasturtii]|uniref:uncharacterized protein LOC116338887 n=1 Tax=Contarinia nasturtii TaxID=265458 RepID=UPI0012D417F7|nr:uncharacterized protein LOC116338887 [Contarinia nasturtii]
MFSNSPIMKLIVLLFFIAATTASPIFFGHQKQTQIFITPRKDTVSKTVNQIPATVVKKRPAAVNLSVPVPIHVQLPVQLHLPQFAKPSTPQEMNKLFTEMKNSKKPFMTVSMKGPPKASSLFPDPFNLFNDDNSEHIVVHVPYNVHTHNIHHHHIQTVPVYKHIPVVKHVPIQSPIIVKEVAIPVHLPAYKEEWSPPQQQWW